MRIANNFLGFSLFSLEYDQNRAKQRLFMDNLKKYSNSVG